jgi:hypothetical protein
MTRTPSSDVFQLCFTDACFQVSKFHDWTVVDHVGHVTVSNATLEDSA